MSYENKSTFLPRRQAWGRDVEESALGGEVQQISTWHSNSGTSLICCHQRAARQVASQEGKPLPALFSLTAQAITSVQFGSVTHSCLTLCRPMDCSTPGFPVHHQLPELARVPSRFPRQLHSQSRNLPQGLWFSRCYCRFWFSVLWIKPTDLYYVYKHIIFNL